jgi:hypothetical protein
MRWARSVGECLVAPWTDPRSRRARAVVPFVHAGMEAVAPRGAALPVAGQAVSVLVGPPVPVADLLAAAAAGAWPDERLYGAIAARVGAALAALKARLDGLPADLVRPRASPGAAQRLCGPLQPAARAFSGCVGGWRAEGALLARLEQRGRGRVSATVYATAYLTRDCLGARAQVVAEDAWSESAAGVLAPLLEEELDALRHPLPGRSARQASGLPPVSARAQEAAAAAYAQAAPAPPPPAAPWPPRTGAPGAADARGWAEAAAYAAERVRRVSALVAARSDAEFVAREVLAPA